MSKRRTLKFRAYDTVKKEWLFGYELPNLGGFNLIGEVTLMGELDSVKLEDWNHVDVMQFTGLLDKTGKEIFEGDIVQNVNDQSEAFLEHSGVYWHSTVGAFTVIFETIGQWKLLSAYDRLEVIGNSHDNPDLL